MGSRMGKEASSAPSPVRSRKKRLMNAARRIFELRQLRKDYFQSPIFGELAWDILLALYIEGSARPFLSAGEICERLGGPPTTTIRWLQYLKNEQLIVEVVGSGDPHISQLDLSERALELLSTYLEASLANGFWAPLQGSRLSPGKG